MSQPVIFTIAAKNYLAAVRALMGSVERFHPEARRVLVLIGEAPDAAQLTSEPYDVIASEELGIPDHRAFHFKYTILELCTAVKPWAAQRIVADYEAQQVIYLDPDILLYDRLDPVFEGLRADANIVLTPHLLTPSEVTVQPSDLDILRSGVYNLGFIGINNSEETSNFLDWWRDRLTEHCVVAPRQGMFVDQKWMDLTPSLFNGVTLLRDPGLNVAYWNLHQRKVTERHGSYSVEGVRLRFFHFSGFSPDHPRRVSKHQAGVSTRDCAAPQSLFDGYRRLLHDNGHETWSRTATPYTAFDNGKPIPDLLRREGVVAIAGKRAEHDPFGESGYRSFLNRWSAPIYDDDGQPSHITRAAYRYYAEQPDLIARFPSVPGSDDDDLVQWMHSDECHLPLSEDLLTPVSNGRGGKDAGGQFPRASPQTLRHNVGPERFAATEYALPFANGAAAAGANQGLTQLMRRIYLDRADLRAHFAVNAPEGYEQFLRWFLTSGRVEYALGANLLKDAEKMWVEALAALPSSRHRLSARIQRIGAEVAGSVRGRRDGVEPGPRVAPATRSEHHRQGKPFGINLIGHLSAPSGVGEAARSTFRAARAAGVPLRLVDVDSEDISPQSRPDLPYYFNVFQCNADETPYVVPSIDPEKGEHYNIGHWAWETDTFPPNWDSSFSLLDEVWAPSNFCVDAVSRRAPCPILRIPYCVDADALDASHSERSRFGLPATAFAFLCAFDALSIPKRKNPTGALSAFQDAFGERSDVHLVIKAHNLDATPEFAAQLRLEAERPSVTLLEETMDRSTTFDLLSCCDCFVSLHRSEGFGLMIAEAMALDKPVICTAYSGNTDFARHTNAFLVDYELEQVGPGCDPYDAEGVWAGPKLAGAARQMQLVATDAQERARVAQAGHQLVRAELSPEAVGRQIQDRLRFLYEARVINLK